MKKILMSVLVIGLVAATTFGATRALFTDTESSAGNTFTAGTIDISVGDEPWTEGYNLLDMKPSYTDYINFTIHNDGTNPANITKVISGIETDQGLMSEPECVYEGGTWVDYGDHCVGETAKSNIDTAIGYDLWVEVYNGSVLVWHQMLYNDDITIDQIQDLPNGMFLGMLPAGWDMKVYQSYHMREETENWAQGDTMSFDITLNAKQLTGSIVLEDKTGDPDWDINQISAEGGTLTYKMSHPTFDFSFTGKALLANTTYHLVAGTNASDPDMLLGTGVSNGSGMVTIAEDVELGMDLVNAKVWLVPDSNWTGSAVTWACWPSCDFLWETGLIEYRDTDL